MTKLGVNPGAKLFQIKITLRGIEPPVWRRLLVPGNIRLDMLHETIQCAMGWKDEHLHEFFINGTSYGDPENPPSKNFVTERSTKAKLKFLNLQVGDHLRYIYDFGDDWVHEILIEEIRDLEKNGHYPQCIGGERACPPEDCGGVPGYMQLLQVLKNPKDEDFDYVRKMFASFDPECFDFAEYRNLPIMLTYS